VGTYKSRPEAIKEGPIPVSYLVVLANFLVAIAAIYWEKQRHRLVFTLLVSLVVSLFAISYSEELRDQEEERRVLSTNELLNPFHRITSMTLSFSLDFERSYTDPKEDSPLRWFPTPRLPELVSSELVVDMLPTYKIRTTIRPTESAHEASVNGSVFYEVEAPIAREGRVIVNPTFDVEGIAPHFFFYQVIPVGEPELARNLVLPELLSYANPKSTVGTFTSQFTRKLTDSEATSVLQYWSNVRVELKAFVRDNTPESRESESNELPDAETYNRFKANFLIPLKFGRCGRTSNQYTCDLIVQDTGSLRLEQPYPW